MPPLSGTTFPDEPPADCLPANAGRCATPPRKIVRPHDDDALAAPYVILFDFSARRAFRHFFWAPPAEISELRPFSDARHRRDAHARRFHATWAGLA